MMGFSLSILCLFLSISGIYSRKLDKVVIISRHGDRAPLQFFPQWDNNTTSSSYWPYGLGQLSKLGKRRIFLQGRALRSRYSDMFKKNYMTPRDVYIQSSGIDRCLETAQVLSAAMLQPKGDWIWAPKIMWQPAPIRSWPPMLDPMLVASSVCPEADRLYDEIPEDDTVMAFLQPYEALMNEMGTKFGIGPDYRSMRNLFDNILTLKHHLRIQKGSGLPDEVTGWLTNETYQDLKTLFEFSFQVDFTGRIAYPLRKMRAGYLLNEIFTMLDPKSDSKRVNILSTHDSTIFHLLDALGYDLKETFKFGVTLLFEATKIDDDPENSQIEIFIANNVKDNIHEFDPKPITLTQICPIEQSECSITLKKMRLVYGILLVKNYEEWANLCQGKINFKPL